MWTQLDINRFNKKTIKLWLHIRKKTEVSIFNDLWHWLKAWRYIWNNFLIVSNTLYMILNIEVIILYRIIFWFRTNASFDSLIFLFYYGFITRLPELNKYVNVKGQLTIVKIQRLLVRCSALYTGPVHFMPLTKKLRHATEYNSNKCFHKFIICQSL